METQEALAHKKCVPCEGGIEPLGAEEIRKYLLLIECWLLDDQGHLVREFVFKDFAEALAFVNLVGALAEEEGHHPDINLHGWNQVTLTLYTHAIGGLHMNDFVLASKINILKKKK